MFWDNMVLQLVLKWKWVNNQFYVCLEIARRDSAGFYPGFSLLLKILNSGISFLMQL